MATIRHIDRPSAKDYLTPEQAATFLGVRPGSIRTYLYKNELTTYKFHTTTLLSLKELRRWKRSRSYRRNGKAQEHALREI